ncbi:conserved hypothetical protein [Candidatus Brocadia pituitae]|nr:conserved hypothetical protein [Candidatus Brocadia pituitae]
MVDQQDDKSSYPIPALLLIVAIIAGGILRFYAPLETMRPPLNEKEIEWSFGEEDVLARMWQDPFQAVEKHIKYFEAATNKPVIVKKFHPPEYINDIENILILPIMTTAERYAENFENRLRSRYAVLSALHVAGYKPKDAEHIGYFERAIHGQTRIIPYEWFLLDPFPLNPSLWSHNLKQKYGAILVLWLGDEYFSGERITGLQNLFGDIKECFEDKTNFKVLGPTNSTALQEIISEVLTNDCATKELLKKMHDYLRAQENSGGMKKDSSEEKQIVRAKMEFESAKINLKKKLIEPVPDREKKFEMYSSWATADPLLMMSKKPIAIPMLVKMYKEVQSADIFKEDDILKHILKHKGVYLQRSIHNDHQLADELVQELRRRGINMRSKSSGDIILISDWDTFYGRALPLSFAISLLKDQEDSEKNRQSSHSDDTISRLAEKIHTFSYMRGIDGMTSNADDSAHSPTKKSIGTAQKNKNDAGTGYFTSSFEQPSGQDQFDYIRRLTERIKRECSKDKVCAIGVLGNDIYDKLLVLRALRDQFPSAIFFTTDLDARLFHHTELPWTRNLIVASSYGLQLHPEYQRAIPPFRSTYQTSLFTATLQALKIIPKEEIDFDNHVNTPRIFEIGHRGAYDLTPVSAGKSDSSEAKSLHPDRHDCWKSIPKKDFWFYLVFMLFLPIIVFVGLFCYNIQEIKKAEIYHAWMKYWVGFLIACILSFGALTFYIFKSSWNGTGEPITFFDGISIWPTELLRLFSGLLALYFLLFSIQSIVLADKKINQLCPESKTNTGPSDVKTDLILVVANIWNEYKSSRKSRNNWCLIGIFTVGYLVAGYFFIQKCGKPLIPFRGGTSFYVDKCVLISSLLFMLVLIMFVINITWLCRKFIKEFVVTGLKNTINTPRLLSARCSLEDNTCGKDGKRCQEKYGECLNKYAKQMTHDTSGYWFTIKIIEEKTKVVGEMIKYPFLILFLLLVSRHKYFDNWTWTIPLAIVIGLTTLVALFCTIILFYEAKMARLQTITRLREEQMVLINIQLPADVDQFNDKKSKLIEQQIRSKGYVMNEIQNMKSGAYSPLISFNNPIIMAILTPLGGIGSISLIQQLSQFLKD